MKKSTEVAISFPCDVDLSPPWWCIIVFVFASSPLVGWDDFAAAAAAAASFVLFSCFRRLGKYGRRVANPMGSSMPR